MASCASFWTISLRLFSIYYEYCFFLLLYFSDLKFLFGSFTKLLCQFLDLPVPCQVFTILFLYSPTEESLLFYSLNLIIPTIIVCRPFSVVCCFCWFLPILSFLLACLINFDHVLDIIFKLLFVEIIWRLR